MRHCGDLPFAQEPHSRPRTGLRSSCTVIQFCNNNFAVLGDAYLIRPNSVNMWGSATRKARVKRNTSGADNLRGRPISRILSKGPHLAADTLWMTIPLPTACYHGGQAANPGLWAEASLWRSPTACDRCGGPFHARPLFGIAPGGACHTVPVARSVVGSYPTVSPSPQIWLHAAQRPGTAADSSLWRFPWGCPRRALPGTLASWSPDFPRRLPPAITQPSAQAPQ